MSLKEYILIIFALHPLFTVSCSHAKEEKTMEPSPWLLAVVENDSNKANAIDICTPESWHVELKNVSSMPQRLWSDSNSWGYSILSFVVKDNEGKIYEIKRKARSWRKNYPGYITIISGESHVFNIALMDNSWELSPIICTLTDIKLQAILIIPEDAYTREHEVWRGRIISGEYPFN
ncbi:MAG: hypothetical protein L0Z73_10540 [Gammaproteobacteria bacterium]|nr:hypothetical protein [Gammaproteobacteria bacterium]